LAMGLTFVLIAGEFDLSIGSMLGLSGAAAITMMSVHGTSWEVAVVVGLLLGVAAGLLNGFLIAYAGTSSFITTLAMMSILLGTEYLFTGDQSVFSNVSKSYVAFGQSTPGLGLSVQVVIAAALGLVGYVVLNRTEAGRRLYAIGGNAEAARMAGIEVRRYLTAAFVVSAVVAAIAGLLVTAQAGSSTPNAGAAYLLPAYAAAFLGTAVSLDGRFTIIGTVVGALFLGVLQDGLTMLGISTAAINIIEGGILIVAVLSTGLGRRAVRLN
jgi:ribose transport system permease protein